MTRLVCVAVLAGAHGVHGDLRLKSFTDDPESVFGYGRLLTEAGDAGYDLSRLREAKPGIFIVRAAQNLTREEAAALKGTKLYVPRDRLPPTDADEFYYEDLVGLEVRDTSGTVTGRVKAVQNFGADDILEIVAAGDGSLQLLPFTKAVVPEIDVAGGFVVVDPPAELVAEPEPGSRPA